MVLAAVAVVLRGRRERPRPAAAILSPFSIFIAVFFTYFFIFDFLFLVVDLGPSR